jgi:hypothetical protein
MPNGFVFDRIFESTMDKNESSCSILRSLNLDDIEETLSEAYHKEGAGRPPRKPIGIFKALIIKRAKQIPSDRELYRRLWNDEALREVCDIEAQEKPYHPSQLTRFRNRVGVERLDQSLYSQNEQDNMPKVNWKGSLSLINWFRLFFLRGKQKTSPFHQQDYESYKACNTQN